MQVYSNDRDADYGRSIYGYDFRRGNGYVSWNRGDHVPDAQGLSWERDERPGRRQECSWSRGHGYRYRSRSPNVSSHSRSHREDNYDNKRNHELSSVVPSIYGSDFKSGNGYNSWKRRDHVRDAQGLSWERDECPGGRLERSWSRGHYYCHRSRSPHVPSHSQSHQEDNYKYDRKRNREHTSVVPSATIIVMGLPKRATAEDLHQILAQWGPLRNVRVIKERNSSSCRGIAFIDFPSVVKARGMMNAIGYDGLVIDGAMLHFEYSLKKIKSKNRQMHENRSRERRRQKAIERSTTDAPALRQQQHQYEEKVLGEEVEEREAKEMESEEEEVEEREAEEVVSEEGEAEDIEVEEMVSEEGVVEESEAEEMVSEEVEAEDSEAEEMESEEEEVEESGAKEVVLEEGEEGDGEVEEMEDREQKTEDNEEEGEELGSDHEIVVDMIEGEGEGEESREEMQRGRVSTKNRPIPWTRKETYFLKIIVALLSRQRTKAVPWTEILRVGSHIFHSKRTPEHLREKDRRMRGDTHRVRTKGGRMNGGTRRIRTNIRLRRR